MTNEAPNNNTNSSRATLRALRMTVAAAALAALSFSAGGLALGSRPDVQAPVPKQTYGMNQFPSEYLRDAAAVTQKGHQATTPPRSSNRHSFSFADLVEHVSPAVDCRC
jgi:hypothetical protein